MAGKYLRDSKGRYAGATTGWQAGKRTAGRAVSGARKKTAAHMNKEIRSDVFISKGTFKEYRVTRGDNYQRVAAEYAPQMALGPAGRGVGTYSRARVVGAQHKAALKNGKAVSIDRTRAKAIVRANTKRVLKKSVLQGAGFAAGAAGVGAAGMVGRGLLGAHRAREGSLMANRALGAGAVRASRSRAGVYNVTSMGARATSGRRIRLGGQRMAAAVKYAANAG